MAADLTLALGIGANTAVFSKLFDSYRDFEQWRSQAHSFERVAAVAGVAKFAYDAVGSDRRRRIRTADSLPECRKPSAGAEPGIRPIERESISLTDILKNV